MTPDDVIAELTALTADDVPTHGGATMAYVYDSGLAEVDQLAAGAQAAFQWTNALDPTAFPSVARIEDDLVAAAAALLGGGPSTVGTVTSGGTESCLLAVLAARSRWRAGHPGDDRRPHLLVPVTAHAAFRKAAHLFDLTVVDIGVDPVTCRVRPDDVMAALSDRAALVVVSAPSYPHGVLDPVAEVAGLAAAAGVPCHVDACIGGWLLPHLGTGTAAAPFDLSVPGVTSLSVDLHKYGYAPKGVSVLLTADPEFRQGHWFSTAGWPGYPVVNPTLAGTRPAGPMAAAWAVHRWLGTEGYARLARAARTATRALVAGLADVPGVRVVGEPVTTLVALAGTDGLDVLHLADEMTARGWLLQPQPPFEQPDGSRLPATLHLTVTAATAERVPALLADLADAARAALELPPPVPDPGLVAAAADLDPAALTVAEVDGLLAFAGLDGGPLPERMAPVHALVAALPRPVAERLLAGVLDRVYRPTLATPPAPSIPPATPPAPSRP